ncbi:MAG TPA: ATP-binding protein [Phycisphaerae bacterium]|nr:ATP-binding protein [Phycisphaerae bacterium]
MVALKEIVVQNDLSQAKRPEEAILEDLTACGYSQNTCFAIKLALEEAMTNAFRHGNKCDPSKHIHVRYLVTPDRIEIEISDEGEGFCVEEVPDPTLPEFIDRPHGRGIMLMRAYLDEVSYADNGSLVRLVKFNKQGA